MAVLPLRQWVEPVGSLAGSSGESNGHLQDERFEPVKGAIVMDDCFDVRVVMRNGRAIVFVRGDIDMASGRAFRDARC